MTSTVCLSKSQYGIYAECAGQEDKPCYNIPYLYTLDGGLDAERLCIAVETAVAVHPTLFTKIELNDEGEPVQTIPPDESFTLDVEEIADIEAEKPRLVVPFKIVGGRLFRIRLFRDSRHYYLFLDIHHIICDGTSIKILLSDIERAYNGEPLQPEGLSMAALAEAEVALRQSPAFEDGKHWYASQFDDADTFTSLLPDRDLPQTAEGSQVRVLAVEPQRVEAFLKESGFMRNTLFTAAYAYLVAGFAGEREALFTTVYNGRTDRRFARSVGMAVRTLPVYARLSEGMAVADLLRQVEEQQRGCRQHEAYSFIDVVHDLGLQSGSMFVWHGDLYANDTFGGKPMAVARVGNSTLDVPLYIKAFVRSGRYCVKAEYNANAYSESLVAQFLESYETVVEGFLSHDSLRDVPLATAAQVAMLDGFNQNDVAYDDTQTVVSLFRAQAQATPSAVAVVYNDASYTYAQVDDLSNRIAAALVARGLAAGDVVSVLIPRCEWMAIASLGVLKAGCAYQPLDPSYPPERLNFMMQDASARMLIADQSLRHLVDGYEGEVLYTSELASLPPSGPVASAPKPDSLFILLYTSGSTGTPKGVQLLHSNIVAFCYWYQRYYTLQPQHRVAAYASYGFDACMMDLYPALTCGASVYIVPEELRLDLVALGDWFARHGITHSFMTTQVAYQFATGIECPSLLHLSSGGEKLASLTPPASYRFYNGYGPTECTIFTTTYLVDRKMKEIPIGKPLDNLRLYVVDPMGRRLPVGAAGELWVSGPQVGRGYLGRPDKTSEVFIPNPFASEAKYARAYRTGDIVRYLPSGDIQFVGRRDGQVKIRGFRIELKEVESIIREYPGIRDATVQAFDDDGGGKYIAAYIVADSPVNTQALNQFILQSKPPYMVPAVTMQIGAIPLNQNQKVNKRALPKPERKEPAGGEPTHLPMNILEEELHSIVAAIVSGTDISVTTPLGYAGLTSISAIKLAVQVNKRFGLALDPRTLAATATIHSIENDILKHLMQAPRTLPSPEGVSAGREKHSSAPLTYAQTGVYIESLKNPTSTVYNIPYLLTFPPGTDTARLAQAVKQAAESHPQLGVHITTQGDNIVQTVDPAFAVQVGQTTLTDPQLQQYKRDFVRPFNLHKDTLCRFEVVSTPSAVHLLMDIHHIVFDGASADLLIRQICTLLQGGTIESESYTYLDYAHHQSEAEQTDAFRQAGQYFASKLQICEGASEIPSDLPATDATGHIGEAVCAIDIAQAEAFCRYQGITPAHLFLAATAYVVSRHTNNREVYLCTVSSGRSNLRIADTVGMFVNTLAVGLAIDDVTVAKFLTSTGQTFTDTLRHEDYPFARIASDYAFRPAIAYAYQVGVLSEYLVNGQAVGQELLELNVPKFRINIKIETRGVVVQYDDAHYTHGLAEGLAESIVSVAERMMAQPDSRLRSLSIVSARQADQLDLLRQTVGDEAPFRLFHECIGHFAQCQPDHEALVAAPGTFTYRQMDDITTRIAASLQARGVLPRDRVALLLPRTSRLILALFGVLKTGSAYIPCDPDYPADRIKLILEDSGAKYIVTTADRMSSLPEGKAIDVEDLLTGSDPYSLPDITPDDLAYIIYTSGSTGRPKGVMLRHAGICNYLYGHTGNVLAHAVLTDADRLLSVTTISFDAALQDIGTAFYNGKTLILATEEQANNPLDLARIIVSQHIDMVSGTPSRWLTWLTSDEYCKAISRVKICRAGGEKFPDQLLQQLRQTTSARIFNCYGPTENTVASNNKELTTANRITVGKPQLGVKEFIVDSDGNELPVGVVGELYIGGRGVARGYNNLDQMNRERFVDYHGERIYKSGDYARWLPDGDVIILGRTDHQIKLRGLRIELGEIENVMLKVDGMKKVVIIIRKLGDKEHLCAYYTADRPIAPDKLKAEISRSLTQYMVPTAYLQLDEMPTTPNGKTDIKALPEPQLAVVAAYEAPRNDAERTFCDIFATILQMDNVGATDNFFELGGTSLVVTRVIIEADKAGLHVAYGDVFANPTPRKLAAVVTGISSEEQEDDEVARYDYTAINNLLLHNTLETFRKGTRLPLGNVLLTGATGYLGIHILHQLIGSDAQNIYCLVRGKTKEKAESRLRTLLFYYFSNAYKELFGSRIHIVLGDVTEVFDPTLKVDTVFNCAAIVKHFSEGTEIEDVNIGGARRCVEFCIKTGAKLVHVSTASTRGLWAGEPGNDVFTEQRLYMGQYLGNKYIYSKYMAERLILDAVASHGLCAKIMRVGNLAARSTDGEFQANFSTNSFMGRIKVYNMLGCCPYNMRSKRVEFSPINEVSQAIVLLATTPSPCCVFHPFNIHTQFLGDVLAGLSSVGQEIRFVEQEEFDSAMESAKNDPQKARQMASLLAYQDLAHGMKTTDVARDNEYTTQVLYRLGFAWSPTSWDYVERMLTALGGFGFFE